MNFLWLKEDPVKNLDHAMARARLGEAYLDERFGPEWDHKICLDRLDIKSPINCVLSQLLRQGHLSLLFLNLQEGVEYGFSCGLIDSFCWIPIPAVNRSFRRLTHAWMLILRERRCQSKSDIAKLQTVPILLNDRAKQDDSLAWVETTPVFPLCEGETTSGIVGDNKSLDLNDDVGRLSLDDNVLMPLA